MNKSFLLALSFRFDLMMETVKQLRVSERLWLRDPKTWKTCRLFASYEIHALRYSFTYHPLIFSISKQRIIFPNMAIDHVLASLRNSFILHIQLIREDFMDVPCFEHEGTQRITTHYSGNSVEGGGTEVQQE